jgi:type II secretory pathway component PulF
VPNYHWKGIDENGNRRKGVLFLKEKDITIGKESIRVELLKQEIALFKCGQAFEPKPVFAKKPIPPEHLATFFHDLSIILESGIPLLKALNLVKNYTVYKKLKKVIGEITSSLEQGKSLSQALKKHFSPLIIQIARSGEKSGELAQACFHIKTYLQEQIELKKQLRQAAFSPTITLIFAVSVIILILIFVVPNIEPFLMSLDSSYTNNKPFLFTLSSYLTSEGQRATIVLGLISMLFGIKVIKRVRFMSSWADKIIFKIPLLGQIALWSNLINFLKTLTLLLKSGAHLKESILLASDVCTNRGLSQDIKRVAQYVEDGKSLEQAFLLSNSKIFPEIFIESIALGEQTGKLENMIEKCTQLFQKRLTTRIHTLTTIIQPILLICVGIFIALLIMGIYLPLLTFRTVMVA